MKTRLTALVKNLFATSKPLTVDDVRPEFLVGSGLVMGDENLPPEVGAPELRIKEEFRHEYDDSWAVPLEPTKMLEYELTIARIPKHDPWVSVHRLDDPEELWEWMRMLNPNYTEEEMTKRVSILVPLSELEIVPGGTRW